MKTDEAALFARWEIRERPYPWNEGHFLTSLTSKVEKVWVWGEENHPAGFVSTQRIEREAYILNLMVAPELRRRGFGLRLISALQERMKDEGAKELWLDVEEGNEAARRLYEKAGFVMSEKRAGAYPRGETAITYRKIL